jgi:hypothetical protein
VKSALEIAGFMEIDSYSWGAEELTSEAERAFFVGRKPGGDRQ